jgi:hypothetical protein
MNDTHQMAIRLGLSAEWVEWYRMSPRERLAESSRMWETFQTLGGTFDPEPDSESPFFDADARGSQPAHGRTGLRVLRSCGV